MKKELHVPATLLPGKQPFSKGVWLGPKMSVRYGDEKTLLFLPMIGRLACKLVAIPTELSRHPRSYTLLCGKWENYILTLD
jgi:hypothetical protein